MDMEMNDDLGVTIDRLAATAGLLEQTVERLEAKLAAAEQSIANLEAAVEAGAPSKPRLGGIADTTPSGRKTLPTQMTTLLAKQGVAIDSLEAGSIDAALSSLSIEQRIAVKSQLIRAGLLT
ncbi:MAG: hypothetical protein M3O31_05480 [Acidobacteriota bacterium]|nr:hypothetical protein [Acidobacteriota bacterium]